MSVVIEEVVGSVESAEPEPQAGSERTPPARPKPKPTLSDSERELCRLRERRARCYAD